MSETATILEFIATRPDRDPAVAFALSDEERQHSRLLSTLLDKTLEEMVENMEGVASCQQAQTVKAANDTIPPFHAFCIGLETICDNLLPHLMDVYRDGCKSTSFDEWHFRWIFESRADALIRYLLQLARVHGLAFDGDPRQVSPAEQMILSGLEAHLKTKRDHSIAALSRTFG